MKKVLSLLISTLMVLAVLAGCSSGGASGNQPATSQNGETPATVANGGGEEITLSFLHHMGEQGKKDGLIKLTEAFTAKNSNVKIEVEFLSMDDFINQYKQRVAADNAPDFVNYRPFQTPDVIEAGLIEPLDASIFPKEIDPQCIESISLNGKIYGVPFDRGGYGLFYNKNLLSKAGVDPATLDTMSGLLKACQKIKDAGITPLASGYAESWTENLIVEGQTWAGLMVKQPNLCADLMTGAKKFTDFPDFKNIITNGHSLVRDYALINDKSTSQQASDQYAQFGRGDAAMMVQGTWAVSDIRIAQKAAGNSDEFGFTVYPWSDNASDNYMAANADDSFMISKDSKHKAEAVEFAKYCLTPKAGKLWANTTGCISAISGVQADTQDPLIPYFLKTMDEHAYYFEVNPGMTGQYYQDFVKIYIQGRISNQSADKVISEWQNAFDNIRKTNG